MASRKLARKAPTSRQSRAFRPLSYLGHGGSTVVGVLRDLDGISSIPGAEVQYPMGLNQGQAEGLLHSASLHLHLARLEVAAAVAAARDAGMSWEAVASVLGEPRTTVQSRYSDALASAAVDLLAEVTYQDEGKHP